MKTKVEDFQRRLKTLALTVCVTAFGAFSQNALARPQSAAFGESTWPQGQLLDGPAIQSTDPLTSQLQSLQNQIDELRQQSQSVPGPTAQHQAIAADSVAPCYAVPNCDTGTTSAKKIRVTGFFHLDSAYFGQSPNSIATLGDIEDGTSFRRARIAAAGDLNEKISFITEFDFAQSQARIVDLWGQINDTPFGNIRIGRYRQPFGMSELTSIRNLPFLERPASVAFAPFRQTGVMFFDHTAGERATWAVSGFRTLSDNFGNVVGDNGGYGTALRLTGLAYDCGPDGLIHVGFNHTYMNPGRDRLLYASTNEVLTTQQTELGPAGLSVLPITGTPPFVNSGVFDVDNVNLINIESAWSFGRGLVQGEYRWNMIDLPNADMVTVSGGYLSGRYMLTGETIPYDRKNGVFGRVVPDNPLDPRNGGWGAWEIATRISTLDLNNLFGQPGISGPTRDVAITTLGLNWYWWENAKSQIQYSYSELDDPVLGTSGTNTVAGRVQFDF